MFVFSIGLICIYHWKPKKKKKKFTQGNPERKKEKKKLRNVTLFMPQGPHTHTQSQPVQPNILLPSTVSHTGVCIIKKHIKTSVYIHIKCVHTHTIYIYIYGIRDYKSIQNVQWGGKTGNDGLSYCLFNSFRLLTRRWMICMN